MHDESQVWLLGKCRAIKLDDSMQTRIEVESITILDIAQTCLASGPLHAEMRLLCGTSKLDAAWVEIHY